jgi:hypothetical protein
VLIRQITHGPAHHVCGYIGHRRTIPWSGDGRGYIDSTRQLFTIERPCPESA